MKCINEHILDGGCLLDYTECKGKDCKDFVSPRKKSIWLKLLVLFVEHMKEEWDDGCIGGYITVTIVIGLMWLGTFLFAFTEGVSNDFIYLCWIMSGTFFIILFFPIFTWIFSMIKNKAVNTYNEVKDDYI